MDRRRLLGSLGALVGTGLAGCTDGDSAAGPSTTPPSQSPASTTASEGAETLPLAAVDTLTYNGEADLDRLSAPFAQRSVGHYYLALLASDGHAETLAGHLRTDHREADPHGFLSATDFSSSVVVVFEDASSSSAPDLEVRAVRRDTDSVELDVVYPGNGGTADVIEDVLLVRVPRGGHAPEHATVALGTGPPLSTVGRYGRSRLDEPRDVVVRNRDCSSHSLHLTATVDGDLVYDSVRREAYPPGSIVRHVGALAEAGDYRVVVVHAGGQRRTTLETTLAPGGERSVLVDVDGSAQVSVRAVPSSSLPAGTHGTCEAGDLPYESSDPSENLGAPVRVTWLNESGTTREIGLVVRDNDRVVVDRTLALAAGEKGHTEPLIAKAGVYEVTLDLGDARRTVRWDVREGSLGLLIEGDGEVQVARDSLAD